MKGKIIVVSAPSGTGKSTVIGHLMQRPELRLEFSISATSRKPRGAEQDGREYYFLTPEEFRRRVDTGEFVEWEEVYAGTCYGTLVSEVERVTGSGHNLIMDVDVKGAMNIKKHFGDQALTIFILPPSMEELENRLRSRNTDTEESIAKRLEKADFEMSFADRFDIRIINDSLDDAVEASAKAIKDFADNTEK
ncbi:MAG: guanylate kinase [Muribaculaceae bacterium]|nr:guanylate kinase [Muribaculaceae bacterium]